RSLSGRQAGPGRRSGISKDTPLPRHCPEQPRARTGPCWTCAIVRYIRESRQITSDLPTIPDPLERRRSGYSGFPTSQGGVRQPELDLQRAMAARSNRFRTAQVAEPRLKVVHGTIPQKRARTQTARRHSISSTAFSIVATRTDITSMDTRGLLYLLGN